TNFARFDPIQQLRGIKGSTNGSYLDEEIWNEFHENWDELAFESEKLLAELKNEPLINKVVEDEVLPLLEGKERETLVRVRVNQGFFRTTVLTSYLNSCCITGINIPDLLIASHIIPWSKDEKNRVNPCNGL